jgi:hypothetical protein
MDTKEKIAHLQHIQDHYIHPVLAIVSSLFSKVAETKIVMRDEKADEYKVTILLVKKALGEIKEISEAASLFLAPGTNCRE